MQTGTKRIRAGTRNGAERLEQLCFDPIEESVLLYRQLQRELITQEELRSGNSELPVSYRADSHVALYGHASKVVADLLRYKYSRVPETQGAIIPIPPPLVVNLTGVQE